MSKYATGYVTTSHCFIGGCIFAEIGEEGYRDWVERKNKWMATIYFRNEERDVSELG